MLRRRTVHQFKSGQIKSNQMVSTDLAMKILSVHLSVKRVHCDKTEERSVQIFYAIRTII